MSQSQSLSGPKRTLVIALQKLILILARTWFFLTLMLAVTILALAFLAPAFMSTGDVETAQAIYRLLAPHDHQLPQRAYFLFGEAGGVKTYPLDYILAQGASATNLRAFVGNAAMGFKTGLNHRMLAIFIALSLGGLIWLLAGERPKLRFIPFLVMAFPLILDGVSHLSSEQYGRGFRETNEWAVILTGGIFSDTFYQGTTIGSLNWLLRTLTGLIFGFGLAWYLFTYLSYRFAVIRQELEPKLRKIGAIK